MKQIRIEFLWGLGLVAAMLLLMLYWGEAQAGGECIDNSCNTTNNYYGNGVETSVTGGLSAGEIAELLTIGVAAGSHQFDFSTQDWQGSLTGAFYDSEDAVSFGIAKRWDAFGKVLLHGNYTQKSGEDLWVVGGTFRF